MKTTNTKAILTLIAVFTTLLTFSCGKEPQPADPTTQPSTTPTEGAKAALSLDTDSTIKDYPGTTISFDFHLTGKPKGTPTVSVSVSENIGAPSLTFDAKSGEGQFRFKTPESQGQEGSITITLKDGKISTTTYAVKVTTYSLSFTGEDIISDGNSGASFRYDCHAESDAPVYNIGYLSKEGDFFSADKDGITILSENHEGDTKEGTVVFGDLTGHFSETFTIKVYQSTLSPIAKEGYVAFTDWAFKKACLSFADTNSDGEVSLDEATLIKEMDISGKGIKDLTGLEAFKNVWKLDTRNNDICNADILKSLSRLYWLDLSGNMNLESFDLSGCTIYFEHCQYEVTEKLHYTQLRRQIGISGWDSPDALCEHSKHIRDTRQTSDWSHQNNIVKIKDHTKTLTKDGKQMTYAICLYGLGYIDVDIQDGSMDRIMRQSMAAVEKYCPELGAKIDYFDIYYMEHLMENRYYYQFSTNTHTEEEIEAIKTDCVRHYRSTEEIIYEKIFNDDESGTKKLLILGMFIHNMPKQNGFGGYATNLPLYRHGSQKPCMENTYSNIITFTPYADTDDEAFYNRNVRPESVIREYCSGLKQALPSIIQQIM